MLSSDGITEGKIVRFSDKKVPKSISIIQEVGGANYINEFNYEVALKYITCIKVKNPDCKVNIFYKINDLEEGNKVLKPLSDSRFHYVNDINIIKKKNQNIIYADSIEFPSDLIILNLILVPNKDLKELRLNNNEFIKFPKEILGLINLTVLDICNNKLTVLPKEIGKLDKIIKLNLNNGQLTSLPIEIGKLVN